MYNWKNSGTIYVSPSIGYDDDTGFLPEKDKFGNGPLRTIEYALGRVEQLRQSGNMRPMTIALCEDYYLTDTIKFKDGINGVTLTSYGERKKLVGGIKIDEWKNDEFNGTKCYSAKVPEGMEFTDFIVNGKPANISRYPKEGYFTVIDTEQNPNGGIPLYLPSKWFVAHSDDLADITDIEDTTVNFYHYWVDSHSPVESYDRNSGKLVMEYSTRFSINTRYKDGDVPEHMGALRYFLTNVGSKFGIAGEWYLDKKSSTVYYVPREGEKLKDMVAYAPIVSKMIEIKEDDIRIDNLEIVCSKGDYKSEAASSNYGFAESEVKCFTADPQSIAHAPGAITFENATRGAVQKCYLHGIGVHAIEIKEGCSFIRIENNEISDIWAGGISIHGGAVNEEDKQTFGCTIRENLITRCGVRYAAGNGVLVRHASNIEISENEISYLDYSGITVGWVWGYADSSTYGNIIRGNHIHHIGSGKLSDMGGIYMLGKQRGTIISENRIHDVKTKVYGGWGIYTDEGSSYMTVENNVVFDTDTEGFHQNYGIGNIVRNNIFAFGGTGCIKASRNEMHDGVLLENNIIVSDGIQFYAARSALLPISARKNVYWDVSGKSMMLRRHGDKIYTYSDRLPKVFGDSYDFETWKANFEKDEGSILADPMFKNIEERDFTLLAASPAIALGFKPLNGFLANGKKD